MSVLVVGLNHKGAPLALLERVALAGDAGEKLLHDVFRADDVAGALVLSTCNRVEIYAEIGKFHGAVAAICELMSRHSHVPQSDLTPYLYVHYEDRAIQHLLAVACGLDSMVVGESQILGQLRQALRIAREQDTLGRTLSSLGSLALRAGKRAQSETSVGQAGASLVTVGLQAAARQLGLTTDPELSLAGRDVLVVGAGAMSGLAVAQVSRAGAGSLTVANRTRQRAERLAASAGGRAADMAELPDLLVAADLVVTCTGSPARSSATRWSGLRSPAGQTPVRQSPDRQTPSPADPGRAERVRPLVLLDLAMPRDVDPVVAERDGVVVVDLDTLAAGPEPDLRPAEAGVAEVRRIMTEELAAYASASRAATVSPTVVALRAKAAQVVDAELARLAGRLDGLDGRSMAEVAKSLRRVSDKLLHDPTVRVKELAGAPGADTYEDALRVLFDLDPATVQAVAQADAQLAGWPKVSDGRDSEESEVDAR